MMSYISVKKMGIRNYSFGKIYKLTIDDLVYIGSTTQMTLHRRLEKHQESYEKTKNGEKGYYMTSFILFEKGIPEITLVEKYPCNNNDELRMRERHWYDQYECVNKIKPFTSKDEYLEAKRQFYQKNKEKILEKQRLHESEKVNCNCGSLVRRGGLYSHKKTKKHLQNIETCIEATP